MNFDMRRHDRLLGALCLVLCPALSGLFLGCVAVLCAYPSDGAHALDVGVIVACAAFLANAFAICLTAAAADSFAQRRTGVQVSDRRRFVVLTNFELPELDLPVFESLDRRLS